MASHAILLHACGTPVQEGQGLYMIVKPNGRVVPGHTHCTGLVFTVRIAAIDARNVLAKHSYVYLEAPDGVVMDKAPVQRDGKLLYKFAVSKFNMRWATFRAN